MEAAVPGLQPELVGAALADGDGGVDPARAWAEPGAQGVFLHAAVERVVADRQQVGLDTQQAAVGQPELAAVQRKGGAPEGLPLRRPVFAVPGVPRVKTSKPLMIIRR